MSHLPTALARLDLPEMQRHIGSSVREAERELEQAPGPHDLVDATYADTHRFPPPEWTTETLLRASTGGGMTYTPYRGDAGVRGAVAQNLREVLGLPAVDGVEPILTPGTQGALFVALASVLEPGDVVLLPDPDYLSTERMLRWFGAEVVRIPMRFPEADGRPVLDAEALAAAAARGPRLLVFSHPNNPTGMVYADTTLTQIAELAVQHDFTVLADQLYCRLVYDGEAFTHLANLPGMSERTITLLGPSKTESMSGFRLGVALAPDALVDRMEDVQSCTALRAPAYAQHLLTRWLADDQDYLRLRVKEYQALRDTTVATLNGSGLMRVRPSYGTSYVFPEVLTDVGDRELSLRLKADAGVVVNPGYQFGEAGLGHLRLCFAQDEQVWEAALGRILDVVGRYPLR
ncbi:aminotransferase class I/II-fold pyridoxal phosphate-dependent enzyme [Desertihabitans brevis]|uniref:Aminotransferase class I/II-fold pyridoxal phosphate-dependent enzyme n=1 Tax=Desertihabitans brevis TaxID=2268447 RepID=A0A367YT60_9ACTN|nr:aminotransferase class I/II-fold pyridoxal phosphate-dependent enzyme [Desertihabitans brevis]RCK69076.1 aminotransferase class I/II-fold pyridoxal phosphate-dependent enzyme [Desertihabitans brevis]